jgi:hypothetical protein
VNRTFADKFCPEPIEHSGAGDEGAPSFPRELNHLRIRERELAPRERKWRVFGEKIRTKPLEMRGLEAVF